jgi:hypothetical protein
MEERILMRSLPAFKVVLLMISEPSMVEVALRNLVDRSWEWSFELTTSIDVSEWIDAPLLSSGGAPKVAQTGLE